jgi:hypothetical protein
MATAITMRGIIYASQALADFDVAALKALEAQAAARNAGLGVTGYLYYEDKRFFQYIEGAHDDVTALMARIELDSRHDVRHLVYDDRMTARRFPAWSMRVLQRAEFAGVDSLIHDHIVFMKQASPSREDASASVWELIDRVRDLRGGRVASSE